MDIKGPGISIWEWAHLIPTIAGVKPANSNILLLGLGGGTVYKQLQFLKHNVDAVEIDQTVVDVCHQFFEIPRDANIQVTDARHYLKKTEKFYDVIIYDAFLSESPPEHLLTKEGFADAVNRLSPNGFLIINFFGFLNGENGYAARSITKTLLESNYNVHLIPTPGSEEYRNLLFVVAKDNLPNYFQSTYSEPGKEVIRNWGKGIIQPHQINTFDAEVLTDAKPNLAKLYRGPAKSWRKGYNKIYTEKLYK